MIDLCARLEKACIQEADAALSLELPHQLRKFQAWLQHLENEALKQTHIHNFFNTIVKQNSLFMLTENLSHIWQRSRKVTKCDKYSIA